MLLKLFRRPQMFSTHSIVNIFSVTNRNYSYEKNFICNFIDHSVIANANPVGFPGLQFLATRWVGDYPEVIQLRQQFFHSFSAEVFAIASLQEE